MGPGHRSPTCFATSCASRPQGLGPCRCRGGIRRRACPSPLMPSLFVAFPAGACLFFYLAPRFFSGYGMQAWFLQGSCVPAAAARAAMKNCRDGQHATGCMGPKALVLAQQEPPWPSGQGVRPRALLRASQKLVLASRPWGPACSCVHHLRSGHNEGHAQIWTRDLLICSQPL